MGDVKGGVVRGQLFVGEEIGQHVRSLGDARAAVEVDTADLHAVHAAALIEPQQRGQIAFYDLFSPVATTAEVIVTFLAILELAKETLVEILQPELLGVIYVRSADAAA